jgi:hypothetical protein
MLRFDISRDSPRGSFDPRDRPGPQNIKRGGTKKDEECEPVRVYSCPDNLPALQSGGKNVWKPKAVCAADSALSSGELKMAMVTKMVTATLNKLAPERFDRLTDLILNAGITDELILDMLIDKIFDKALTEGHYGSMYAKLCLKLSEKLPLIQDWITIDQKNNIFRRVLLNKCQREFEAGKNWAVEEAAAREQAKVGAENMTLEERTAFLEAGEKRIKSKIRSLGNVHFVGELFKINMLTEKIMHRCVTNMLQNVMNPEEAEIESLCKLLTTIGKYLDHPAAAKHMKQYFIRIAELSRNEVLPSRIRFMLSDLIELRRLGWADKHVDSVPKTLAEIKNDLEKITAAKAGTDQFDRRGSKRGEDRGGDRGGNGSLRNTMRDQSRYDRPSGGRGPSGGGGGGRASSPKDTRIQTSVDGWSKVYRSSIKESVNTPRSSVTSSREYPRVGRQNSTRDDNSLPREAPKKMNMFEYVLSCSF